MKKFSLLALLGFVLPFTGFAHEGHGHTHGFTITHYLIEPEHVWFTLLFLLTGFYAVKHFVLKAKRTSK